MRAHLLTAHQPQFTIAAVHASSREWFQPWFLGLSAVECSRGSFSEHHPNATSHPVCRTALARTAANLWRVRRPVLSKGTRGGRGAALRCVIDENPDSEPVFHLDDHAPSLRREAGSYALRRARGCESCFIENNWADPSLVEKWDPESGKAARDWRSARHDWRLRRGAALYRDWFHGFRPVPMWMLHSPAKAARSFAATTGPLRYSGGVLGAPTAGDENPVEVSGGPNGIQTRV